MYILYINKKELFENYNYIDHMIFLQKTDTSEKNCLGEIDNHQCIEKHQNDKYYPTRKQIENLNYPNIIKIPQGLKGIKGLDGYPGLNQGSTFRKRDNIISKITSTTDEKLEIKSIDNKININNINDIKLARHSKICIHDGTQDQCIGRGDIKKIIEM